MYFKFSGFATPTRGWCKNRENRFLHHALILLDKPSKLQYILWPMDIRIKPKVLKGTVTVSGNKNAALPVIAASILSSGKVTLYHIPDILDVRLFLEFLESIGTTVKFNPRQEILELDYSKLKNKEELVIDNPGKLSKIRAVILLLAGLISRFKKVVFKGQFSGCTHGLRPLTVHFKNLEKLGVTVKNTPDAIELSAAKPPDKKEISIWQKEQSVTATEVAMIVSASFKVPTTIYNAACEPHVQDLGLFLNSLGYEVKGLGTNRIRISPDRNTPRGIKFSIRSDHHEIVTFLALSALTGQNIKVKHTLEPQLFTPFVQAFETFGYRLKTTPLNQPLFNRPGFKTQIYKLEKNPKTVNPAIYPTIKPHPWPGIPVDTLPLFIPLAAYHTTPVLFHNWMYDGALFWSLELRKAGVNVLMLDPHRVLVAKGPYYTPATFEAPYIIRATIALLIFAMTLKGTSIIKNADSLKRAHPNFPEKLRKIGVDYEEIAS